MHSPISNKHWEKFLKYGAVVQLVRIPACHAGGRGFESRPHRKNIKKASNSEAFFLDFFKLMTYSVYIIYSSKNNIYYKGYSENLQKRLREHNEGLSRFTSNKGPWELVWFKEFKTKKEALIEEKRIKKLNHTSILKLIQAG